MKVRTAANWRGQWVSTPPQRTGLLCWLSSREWQARKLARESGMRIRNEHERDYCFARQALPAIKRGAASDASQWDTWERLISLFIPNTHLASATVRFGRRSIMLIARRCLGHSFGVLANTLTIKVVQGTTRIKIYCVMRRFIVGIQLQKTCHTKITFRISNLS